MVTAFDELAVPELSLEPEAITVTALTRRKDNATNIILLMLSHLS
jgi:hypothetical protein